MAELLAAESIRAVISRYAHGIDTRDAELYLSCFTPDVRVEYDGTASFEGIDAMREMFAHIGDEPSAAELVQHRLTELDCLKASTHLMCNTLIDFDAELESARAVTSALACIAGPRGGDPVVFVRGLEYRDEFVQRDGRWLIRRRSHRARWMIEGAELLERFAAK
jgi:ketosteroid isomerase-like protein